MTSALVDLSGLPTEVSVHRAPGFAVTTRYRIRQQLAIIIVVWVTAPQAEFPGVNATAPGTSLGSVNDDGTHQECYWQELLEITTQMLKVKIEHHDYEQEEHHHGANIYEDQGQA